MRVTPLVLAIVLVALIVPALAPTAGAQGAQVVKFGIACPTINTPIKPLVGTATTTCVVTQTIDSGVTNPIGAFSVALDTPGLPAHAAVTLSPPSLVFPAPQAGTKTQTQNFDATVAFTADAPALVPLKIGVTGVATSPQSTAEGAAVLPGQFAATPDYFNLYSVRSEAKIQKTGPQEVVEFLVTIQNYSNGQTRFTFSTATPPDSPVLKKFQAVSPDTLVLGPKIGNQIPQDTVKFTVYTPFRNGYVNDIGAIQFQIDSFYAFDATKKGVTTTVSTLTQGRGFYVPGFELPLLLTVLGAAAMIVGRRRHEE